MLDRRFAPRFASPIKLTDLVLASLTPLAHRSFRSFGLELHLTDCGAEEIASACFDDKTGARGLGGLLESIVRDFKFELGGRFDKPIDVVVDRKVVQDPRAGLEKLMESLN